MRLRLANWVMFLIQAGTVCVGLVLAWLLRFDFALPHIGWLLSVMPILVTIRWATLYRYQLMHAQWRYTGIGDLNDLLKAVVAGSVILFIVVRVILGIVWFPRSAYFLEGMLAFLLLAGLRVGARMLLQARESARAGVRIPVLIVGAGSATAELLPMLERKATWRSAWWTMIRQNSESSSAASRCSAGSTNCRCSRIDTGYAKS